MAFLVEHPITEWRKFIVNVLSQYCTQVRGQNGIMPTWLFELLKEEIQWWICDKHFKHLNIKTLSTTTLQEITP